MRCCWLKNSSGDLILSHLVKEQDLNFLAIYSRVEEAVEQTEVQVAEMEPTISTVKERVLAASVVVERLEMEARCRTHCERLA